MGQNLNQLLVDLAGLPQEDTQLPTPVLLPLTRHAVLPPMLNLYKRLRNRDVAGNYAAAEEAAYLAPAQEAARAFYRDKQPEVNIVHKRQSEEFIRSALSSQLPAGHYQMQHILHSFAVLNTHRPGRQVGGLLFALWQLSWDKTLMDSVDAMDQYLQELPQLILNRYI